MQTRTSRLKDLGACSYVLPASPTCMPNCALRLPSYSAPHSHVTGVAVTRDDESFADPANSLSRPDVYLCNLKKT